ncbi:MAG: hypothetical protein GC157_10845 [Frankiales bacterium]|nr:hypothetical protein [Frankiales bacterium]
MSRRPARLGARAAVGAVLAAALAVAVPLAPRAAAAHPAAVHPAGAPVVARAAAASDPVPVSLTSLEPVVPAPGDTLVIQGVVRNTSSSEVSGVAVRLRLSPTPVRARAEIPQILAGDAGRTGIAVEATRTAVADTLAPGQARRFTLHVALDSLGLPEHTPEVVVLVVESLGTVAGSSQGEVQTGLTRAFLPWFPDPGQVSPTPVVWLFPLTSAPSRLQDGVFLDDHLATEVAPTGRLSHLLDAAETAPSAVSWVIDPALVQSLQDMADGYVVRAPDGTEKPGTGAHDAAEWLRRLQTLTATAEVTASAYADPDVVALHRAGLDVDIALAATTARDVLPALLSTPVGGGLAWPAGGLADDGTLDVLRAAGSRVVVLSSTALPPSPAVGYTPSGSVDLATGGSPLRAAVADATVSDLVAAPGRRGDPTTRNPVVRRQATLAEIAMTTLELPGTPRTLVIAPDTRWSPVGHATRDLVAALAASPWERPESLATLTATPASDTPRARADYPAAARDAELPPGYLAAVSGTRSTLAGLRDVAPDTAATSTAGYEEALTRTESSAWRSDRVVGARLLGGVRSQIDAQVEQVHVLSRAPVTLPGDSGVIPVTVANDLDRPARVGVRLTGTPSTRFVATDVPPITIEPGEKQTLEVTARVLGTGSVSVDIMLVTPEGQRFGSITRTEVRSAAYARAAQWVVGGLFGVLVVLLGINFVRRRRPSAAAADGPGTGEEGTNA